MRKRLVTGLVAFGITLYVLFSTSPIPIGVLCLLILAAGFRELARITSVEDRPLPTLGWLLLSFSAPLVPVLLGAAKPWALVAAWAFLVAGVAGVFVALRRGWASPMSAAWFGAPLGAALAIHGLTSGSGTPLMTALFLLLAPVWAGDIGAMVVGRAFGRHRLAPRLSPGKTWEGAFGGFAAAVGVGVAAGTLLGAAPVVGVGVGATAGLFGQLGDLLESGLKRASGIKDSGFLLPGHGGILDRLDSFLLAFIPSATLLWLLAPQFFHPRPWP